MRRCASDMRRSTGFVGGRHISGVRKAGYAGTMHDEKGTMSDAEAIAAGLPVPSLRDVNKALYRRMTDLVYNPPAGDLDDPEYIERTYGTELVLDADGDPASPHRRVAKWFPKMRCTANKSNGQGKCRAYAIAGGTVCVYHGGMSPSVRLAAKMRLASMGPMALDTMVELMEDREVSPAVRARIAESILKLSGIGTEQVEVNVTVRRLDLDAAIQNVLASRGAVIDVHPVDQDIEDIEVVDDEETAGVTG